MTVSRLGSSERKTGPGYPSRRGRKNRISPLRISAGAQAHRHRHGTVIYLVQGFAFNTTQATGYEIGSFSYTVRRVFRTDVVSSSVLVFLVSTVSQKR